MKYCATCNLEYPETSRFCKSCGKQLGEQATGALPSSGCPNCGALVQGGWKFCKQCGHASDEVTVVQVRPSSLPQPRAFSPAPAPVYTSPSPAVPSPQEEECRTCAHRSAPGSLTCESCGAPVGTYARKRRRKKFATAAAVVLVILILATGVGAAAWYAMGIRVAIQTDPGDSKVVIDGQEVGKTNSYGVLTTPRMRAGDHSLAVMRDGYDEWKQSFTVAFTDLSKSLNVKLNATKFKLMIVSSPSNSEVLVDNNSIGKTNEENGNLETAPLAPGDHTVVVRHDGYRDWKQTVKLGGDQKIEATLSSAPVVDANSSSADGDIRNALEGWAQSSRNRDTDAHMRYYADTLDYYYNRTLVPSSKVRDDRTKAFTKFNSISIQLSNLNVQLDSTGQRATVVLDKTFDFKGDNNAFYNGSVQDQLTLTKLGGAWLITGEKELKIYYVNK